MSMYSFRGGPWHGFVIEYGEQVRPDDMVRPGTAHPPDEGHYVLRIGAGAYVWNGARPARRLRRTSSN
jgi:hypothetical protein